jgi:hypothetical protein
MNTRLLLRLPVVLVSLLLVGGYVYVRAGGGLPWKTGSAMQPPAREQPSIALPKIEPISAAAEALPGSKSAIVFEPSDGALPVVTQAEPNRAMMGGTKSAAVFVPSDAAPEVSASDPQGSPSALSEEEVKKLLIYGSKSAPVFLPSDTPPPPAEQPQKGQASGRR